MGDLRKLINWRKDKTDGDFWSFKDSDTGKRGFNNFMNEFICFWKENDKVKTESINPADSAQAAGFPS